MYGFAFTDDETHSSTRVIEEEIKRRFGEREGEPAFCVFVQHAATRFLG